MILWQMDPPDSPVTRPTATSLTCPTRRPMSIRHGYGLTLDASQSSGVLPTSTFLDGHRLQGRVIHLSGENVALSLAQGKYKVKLEATGWRAGGNRLPPRPRSTSRTS